MPVLYTTMTIPQDFLQCCGAGQLRLHLLEGVSVLFCEQRLTHAHKRAVFWQVKVYVALFRRRRHEFNTTTVMIDE